MSVGYASLGERVVALAYPDEHAALVGPLLGLSARRPARAATLELSIVEVSRRRYALRQADNVICIDGLGQLAYDALVEAQRHLTEGLPGDTILLHAAAVARDQRAIVVAGDSRSGKSTLVAWLMSRGFGYLSDEITTLSAEGEISGLYRPLTLRPDVWTAASKHKWITQVVSLADRRRLAQAPANPFPTVPLTAGLIILTTFRDDATARLERVTPARGAALLMARSHGGNVPGDLGFEQVLELARTVPVVRLVYGDVSQLGMLELFIQGVLDGGAAALDAQIDKANPILEKASAVKPAAIPTATPRREDRPKLTIGMATYDDFDGVYFTIQALRMYHPEVMQDVELLLIDNNPSGAPAEYLKRFETFIPNFRYVPLSGASGPAATKERIFDEASGAYVLVIDCHVMLPPGAIAKLLHYYDAHPDTQDLIQGPLLYDGLTHVGSHWTPEIWRGGMWGIWETDPRSEDTDGEPFEIPMNGMGLFSCRRDAWVGFNPNFRGFGGEEGYIQEKFRQRGHKALCLPFLRWMHRFARPMGIPYPINWEDRIFNYFLGHTELGLPTGEMEAHFEELLGADIARKIFADVRGELDVDAMPQRIAAE